VVTHKLELLQLVDRIIVIANNQVVMDGAKNQVIERLSKPNKNKNVEAD
jgi:ATP-binding cassette subfamily C protein LapB